MRSGFPQSVDWPASRRVVQESGGEREEGEEASMPAICRWQDWILLGPLSLGDGSSGAPCLLLRRDFYFWQ